MMRTSRQPSRRPTDRLLWGAPRVHGELMKLGIEISEATVSKYMTRLPKPPSQTWRTFFRNHANCLASIDFFVSPTATFRLLYGSLSTRLGINRPSPRVQADRAFRRDSKPDRGMGSRLNTTLFFVMQDGAVSVADHLPLHRSGANPHKRLQHGGGTPYHPCVSAVGVCHAGSLQGADRLEQHQDKAFRSDSLGELGPQGCGCG